MPQTTVQINYDVAFAGMEPDNGQSPGQYLSRVSNETTLQLPFGTLVMEDSAAYGVGCKAFASQAGVILGVIPYASAYQVGHELAVAPDSNGNLGLLPGTNVTIKQAGTLWVQIDENVTPASAVRVRTANSATAVGPGTFRASAVSSNTVNLSAFARWCGSYTAANGYGLMAYDFTPSAGQSSD